jgi:hypothetical protein
MTQKWNLQDIRPAEPRRRQSSQRPPSINSNPNQSEEYREEKDLEIGSIQVKDGQKESKKKYIALTSVVVVLIVAVFSLSSFLSKTTLTVFPDYWEPTVNAEFTAYPDKREGALNYEIITLEESGERQITATGNEYVETQAKGFLEIIKSTPGSERLIKNTRFRSPDGIVFRVQESVVVPGAIRDTAGTLVPGTIRAEVFADAVGQEYNLAANTRFDVPGFKESNLTELYESIYAVNRDAITGGFKGDKFIINDNELSTTRQALQLELRDKLLAKIETEKPAGFITFPSSVSFTYEQMPSVSYGDSQVTIIEKAVLQMPLFKQGDFAAFLAKETIPTYGREPVRIVDTSTLTFSYTDLSINSQNIANQTALVFKIVGKPVIVSEFNTEQLQKDLAGKAKTSISTVLTNHPGIRSAKVSSKPFWRRSFPIEPENIVVIEVIGVDR